MKILVTGGTGTLEADVVVHLAGGQKGGRRRAAGVVAHEARVRAGGRGVGIPFTILRAAQFHDLTLTMVRGLAKLPVVPVPGMRLQPVDARDVASRIAGLALREPSGRVPDLAGPPTSNCGSSCATT